MSRGLYVGLIGGLLLLYAMIFLVSSPGWNDSAWLFASAYLGLSLVGLSAIDMRSFLLPDALTLPIIVFGLTWHLFRGDPLLDYVAGAVIGYGLIYGLSLYWRRYRGAEVIGLGDAKLLAGAGAMVGATHLPFILLIGSTTALAVHGGLQMLWKSKRSDYVAFGPYLALGLWIIWCFAR